MIVPVIVVRIESSVVDTPLSVKLLNNTMIRVGLPQNL